MKTVYIVEWVESERGWGIRPDGYSVHGTKVAAEAFIKAYWARQPDGPAPDEYVRPEAQWYAKVPDDHELVEAVFNEDGTTNDYRMSEVDPIAKEISKFERT